MIVGCEELPNDLDKYDSESFKGECRRDRRLITIWNIIDDVNYQEMIKLKSQLQPELFTAQVLQKNIQNMIFIFKRVILNDCETFLNWFKSELIVN